MTRRTTSIACGALMALGAVSACSKSTAHDGPPYSPFHHGSRMRRNGRWIGVDADSAGTTAVDSAVSRLPSGHVLMWVRHTGLKSGPKIGSDFYHVELDCSARRYRVVDATAYDSAGTAIPGGSLDSTWSAPVPDSRGETLYRVGCGPAFPDDTTL